MPTVHNNNPILHTVQLLIQYFIDQPCNYYPIELCIQLQASILSINSICNLIYVASY